LWQWLRRVGRASQAQRHSRVSFRPRLEALEDRCVPSTLTVSSDGDNAMQVGTLRWAVANAQNGDTIQITPENGGGGRHIVLTHGELYLNHEVNIEAMGPRAIIDGFGSSRVFEVARGASVNLDNLLITGGNAKANNPQGHANFDGDGGGILNEGWLSLDQCVVENNGYSANGRYFTTVKKGGGIYNYDHAFQNLTRSNFAENFADIGGGGIYNDRGEMDMTSTIMLLNTTNGDGGALYNNAGTAQVDLSSSLYQNHARRGGGIATVDGNLEVSHSDLEQNTASNLGGAIFDYDSWVTIRFGTTVKDNQAVTAGGGICSIGGGESIDGSSLIHNSTKGSGGGIYSVAGFLDVTNNSHLDNNSAGVNGGAVCVRYTTTKISDSDLNNNNANGNGAGIYQYHDILKVTNCHLESNIALGNGGGIYTDHGWAQVIGSNFVTDSAIDGGGIYNAGGGTLKVGTSQFLGCSTNIKGAPYIDLGGNTFI
jgi:hypothetical protein